MKQRTHLSIVVRAALLAAFIAMPFGAMPQANAVQTTGVARNVHYVAAFQPLFGANIPFSGRIVLNFNNGIVSGSYSDMSIQPNAPFSNRVNVPISGGVDGDNIHFSIGGTFTFNGKIERDAISGSATFRGQIYQFLARQGVPKH